MDTGKPKTRESVPINQRPGEPIWKASKPFSGHIIDA
jgi:hypothetical protein